MFFSVYTLGCKLNQLETEAIIDSFTREAFTFIPWDSADPPELSLIVINTCTVTSMSEQKARRIIRKALKDHPRACLIITGCYAQMERDALSALEGNSGGEPEGVASGFKRRLFVIPGEMKDRVLDLPGFLRDAVPDAAPDIIPIGQCMFPVELPELIASWLAALPSSQLGDGSFRFRPVNFASHSRGFLKIQDGCDRRCAYCRVSLARGKSRSLEAGEVLKELNSLEQRGFAEAVLTGVNISQYRDSNLQFPGLPGLLDFLLRETEKIRIRLSSIEPDEVSDDFIRVLANPRIRPHFHLSLQSGSATILARMGRAYTPADVEETVKQLRSVRKDPFLACDIIAGFPGETEEEFEKTKEFCEHIGFAWIHAFPFSRRPGTAAYHFPEKVNERDADRRVELLTGLARKGRREYISRWEGKEVEVIVEKGEELQKGFVPGVSENYLKLLVACGVEAIPVPGSLIRCRISGSGISRFDARAESICRTGQKAL